MTLLDTCCTEPSLRSFARTMVGNLGRLWRATFQGLTISMSWAGSCTSVSLRERRGERTLSTPWADTIMKTCQKRWSAWCELGFREKVSRVCTLPGFGEITVGRSSTFRILVSNIPFWFAFRFWDTLYSTSVSSRTVALSRTFLSLARHLLFFSNSKAEQKRRIYCTISICFVELYDQINCQSNLLLFLLSTNIKAYTIFYRSSIHM